MSWFPPWLGLKRCSRDRLYCFPCLWNKKDFEWYKNETWSTIHSGAGQDCIFSVSKICPDPHSSVLCPLSSATGRRFLLRSSLFTFPPSEFTLSASSWTFSDHIRPHLFSLRLVVLSTSLLLAHAWLTPWSSCYITWTISCWHLELREAKHGWGPCQMETMHATWTVNIYDPDRVPGPGDTMAVKLADLVRSTIQQATILYNSSANRNHPFSCEFKY